MLKQIASEINFRRGYRGGDIRHLQAAVKQNRFNARAALELGRRGVGEPICASVLMSLSGLRDFANGHPLSDDSNVLLELIARHLQSSRGQSFQDVVAL